MYTLDGEILRIKNEIKQLKEEIDSLDTDNPDNRFKIPSKKSELRILYQKLDTLLEEKNNNTQVKRLIPNNPKK